jgi:hypothetical protein
MRITLYPDMFRENERVLYTHGALKVATFRFESGVAGLRVQNSRGEITMLPFQGQQIWRAFFDGRELTMRSMFDQPKDTRSYLETYGGFLIHCGLAGLGAPGPDDTHPLHGELPNAPFQSAWLDVDVGAVTVGGSYQHTLAFSTNYRATIETKLTLDAALLDVAVKVENLKQTPMDLMYLGHANFRPVDFGELHYSAPHTPEAVRVRRSIPAHVTPKPGYAEFLTELAKDPTGHHVLTPGIAFDPEVVFEIDMDSDADGFAHALQKHPNGTADYMRCRPDQAPLCTRWICRTPDQDGLGVAFPSTSGVEGYSVEKAKGRVHVLDGGQTWRMDMRLGLLTQDETIDVISQIDAVKGI